MNLQVHYPDTPQELTDIQKRVAEIHLEQIQKYLDGLECPIEQKIQLLDMIANCMFDLREKNG